MAKSQGRFLAELLGSDGKVEKAKSDAGIYAGANVTIAADGTLTTTTLPLAGGALTGAVTTNSTFDGRDVAADGVTADAALPKAGGAMTGAITTNSTFDGVDIATRDAILTSTTTTANAALPKAGGTMTGALTGTTAAFNSGGTNVVASFTSTDTIGAIQLADNAGNVEIGAVGNDFHIMNAGGAAKMIVQSDGNVGIGTTAPDTLLELRKDTASSGYGAYPTLSLRNDNAAGYSAIHFQEGSTQRARVEVGNNSGTPYMGLYTTSGASGITIKDGNVGIGTTSPHGKLQFASDINTRKIVLYEGADNDYQFYGFGVEGSTLVYSTYTNTDDHVFFSGASTTSRNELMRITGGGKVGIGTAAPGVTLDILTSTANTNGVVRIQNNMDNNYEALRIHSLGNFDAQISFLAEGSSTYWGGFGIDYSDAGKFKLQTDNLFAGGSTLMTWARDGNVGIGNTAPLGKLTISNAAGANAPTSVTAANTYLQLGSDDYGASNNGKFMIGFGYTDATNTNSPAYIGFEETSTSGDTKGELTFYTRDVHTDTAPTERLRITDGGNIVVGNSSYGSSLGQLRIINDAASAPASLSLFGYNNISDEAEFAKIDFASQISGTGGQPTAKIAANIEGTNERAAHLTFHTHNDGGSLQERMRIISTGNVGIGTTSPAAELEVAGTALVENAKLKAIAASNSDTAVDVFVYDTRKDSDGGAWRKRTQHTSWYSEALNTSTRGARKEFPSVAVIVAESGVITIYDGDDPDMPMWMVFNGTSLVYGTVTAGLEILNGIMFFTGNVSCSEVNFITEFMGLHQGSSISQVKPVWAGGILQRNSTAGSWVTEGAGTGSVIQTGTLVNQATNDIAMKVLPNAPIDANTGLSVPTVALATDGGVSIIKDDGTVVDFTNSSGSAYSRSMGVSFTKNNQIRFMMDASDRFYRTYNIPEADVSVGQWSATSDQGLTVYMSPAYGDVPNIGYQTISCVEENAVGGGNGLLKFEQNDPNPAASLFSYTASDYNTGWMVGDIKLATLSDTVAADDNEYVGGYGNFTDATAWTADTGWSLSGNVATKTASTGANYITRASSGTFVSGEWYQAEFDLLSGNGTHVQLVNRHTNGVVKPYLNGATNVDVAFFAVGSKCYAIWKQNTNNTNIVSLYASQAVSLDNFKIYKLNAHDRSVNSGPLIRYGTVTKTAVATGAELMAYSGFSSSNALQTSYSSSFAVGTEFSASMWLKGGSAGQTPFAVEGTNASDTDSTILIHTHGNGFYFYTRGANDASWSTTGAASIQSTNVGLSEWHMVTLSQDATGRKLYIDGKLNVSDAVVKTIDGVEGTLVVNVGARPPNFFQNYTGKISLVRFSGTPVSPEQVAKMYNDEKHLFQTNAKATLYGTSNAVTALAYDDATELLHVGTSAGRSEFQGLNRVNNTTDAVSAAISASNGFIVEE